MTLFDTIHNGDHPQHGPNLRGEYGETLAIIFFAQHGYRVAKSNGDHYPYDLLVERHGVTNRIQVKTTRGLTGKYYRSTFSVSNEWDAALIITEAGEVFLIPRMSMTFENPSSRHGRSDTRRFVLYPKYESFRVGRFVGFDQATPGDVVEQLERLLNYGQEQD